MRQRSHRWHVGMLAALVVLGLSPGTFGAAHDPVEFDPVPEELVRLAEIDLLEVAMWWRQQLGTEAGPALVHLPARERGWIRSVTSATRPELPALVVLHTPEGRPLAMGAHPPSAQGRIELPLDPGHAAFAVSLVVFPEEGTAAGTTASGPVGVCDDGFGIGDGGAISSPSGGSQVPGFVGSNPLGFCSEGTTSWVNTGPCPPESAGGDTYMNLSLETDGKSEMHAQILDGPSTMVEVRVPISFILKQDTFFCVPSGECGDSVTHRIFAPGKELNCPPESDIITKCSDNTIDFVCEVDVPRYPTPFAVPADVGEDGTSGGSASGVGGK